MYGKIAIIISAIFVVGILFWAVYAGIIRPTTKPNPTETQQAEQIHNQNIYLEPHFGGCARLEVKPNK